MGRFGRGMETVMCVRVRLCVCPLLCAYVIVKSLKRGGGDGDMVYPWFT